MRDTPTARALLKGEGSIDEEIVIHDREGRPTHMAVSAIPVRDGAGKVTAVVSLFRDVTKAREAEQLKDDFLSLISHELRTPLTTIQGAAHMLLTQGDQLSHESRDALRIDLINESERLSRMLKNMLALSAYQAGRLHIERDPFLIQPVLRQAAREVQARYPAHRVVVEAARHLPPAEGDEELIAQAVRNLAENAAKYSPGGGTITLGADAANGLMTVFIRDQGPGIADTEQGRIFQRFHRASTGTQGMGLGLYLCERLVEAHGGAHLGREPIRRRGDLPVHAADCRRGSRSMIKKPTILVVDDEPPIVRLVQMKLEADGMRVRTAHTGPDALAALEDEPVDLVVLDVTMPGMDGFETLRHIRTSSNVPVIMLTARTLDADKLRGLTGGADDYMTKPFNPDELAARVAAVLRRTGGQRDGHAGRTALQRCRDRSGAAARHTRRCGGAFLPHGVGTPDRTGDESRQSAAAPRTAHAHLGSGVPRREPVPAYLGEPAAQQTGRCGADHHLPRPRLSPRIAHRITPTKVATM